MQVGRHHFAGTGHVLARTARLRIVLGRSLVSCRALSSVVLGCARLSAPGPDAGLKLDVLDSLLAVVATITVALDVVPLLSGKEKPLRILSWRLLVGLVIILLIIS